jgi:hypothetical protein
MLFNWLIELTRKKFRDFIRLNADLYARRVSSNARKLQRGAPLQQLCLQCDSRLSCF